MVKLFVNSDNVIYSGDRQGEDLELPESAVYEYIEQKEKEIKKNALQKQIDEIDKKRVRAIAEPQLKDAESGQTWLEYYTQQIVSLRQQIAIT